jgi:hypothetical protein
MVVGFASISLMSPHVCVYDSITNSPLEVVMEQLQLDSVNLCSERVCVNKCHMHATHISMQLWSTSLNKIKGRLANIFKMQNICISYGIDKLLSLVVV